VFEQVGYYTMKGTLKRWRVSLIANYSIEDWGI
jgi:hypothetical protein